MSKSNLSLEKLIINYEDEIIGKKYNGKYGKYIVLGATNKFSGISSRLYVCKFENPEYLGLFRKEHILNDKIKNPYYPKIYNIACSGLANSNHYIYGRWLNMIKRCYNKNSKDYQYYGKKGISVCERWLCFEYFIEDISLIKGWNEEKVKQNLLELDKDKFCKNIYSKETCEWMPKKENMNMANEKQINNLKIFKAIRLNDKYVEYSKSQNAFSKKYNLHHEAISRCLLKKQKYHKGWAFYYDE